MNVKEEDAALICGAGRTQDRRDPLVQIIAFGASTAIT
jgi:hypothetical protein